MAGAAIDNADVQGTNLRGYRGDLARHFVLSITNVAKAGAIIDDLVASTGGMPRITTAERRARKPECFDNIAQPTVLGALPRKHDFPDDQPVVPTGEILLGYTNAGGGTPSV